jgi:glycosyltransferase involved in cell wall biosynthesis
MTGPHPPHHPAAREATVTFVIPCYNHGKFVMEAARSCLAQEQTEARVVIVDDGSDDGTTPRACDACKDLPGWVEVIHQKNKGLPAARNVGAHQATIHESEYLVFLDADDYLEPSFVRKLRGAIESARGGDVADTAARGVTLAGATVSHAYCQERLTDKAFGIWAVPAWDPILLLVTNLHPVTALIRRECFEALGDAGGGGGGFDESMRRGYEDWDLWLRFAARGWRGVRVREPLFNWRRHSETTMVMESVKHHEELFRALVAKHRAMYQAHAGELVVRSNVLLRKADANWLDENLEAIYIRDLRARNIELVAAQREAARLATMYESKPALKFSRRLHGWLDALPRPVGDALRRVLRVAKGE